MSSAAHDAIDDLQKSMEEFEYNTTLADRLRTEAKEKRDGICAEIPIPKPEESTEVNVKHEPKPHIQVVFYREADDGQTIVVNAVEGDLSGTTAAGKNTAAVQDAWESIKRHLGEHPKNTVRLSTPASKPKTKRAPEQFVDYDRGF